jgi:hypothetical protein
MPHPDHHARRAAQSARSLAKLATVAAGNGRRTALLGLRAVASDPATATQHVAAAPSPGTVEVEQRYSAQHTAACAWDPRRD